MRYSEVTVPTDDGQQLFVRHYAAGATGSGRTVLLEHGFCEHGARYDHFARRLVEHGWSVVVPDLRGHGLSSGVRTHVSHFRRYVADLELVREHFGLTPERTALFGHSTGGLIAIRHLQVLPGRVAALAMSSPLLGVKVPIHPCTIALGRVLSYIAPRTRFRSRVDSACVTRNVESLNARLADPLVGRSVTAAWYFAMKAALAAAWAEAGRLDLPLLILQAGDDRIVDAEAARDWCRQAGSRDKTFELLPEAFHEIINEPNWPETTARLLAWLETRVPAATARQQSA